MKHPQTLAIELFNHFPCQNLKIIKDNSCCALVLMWCLGIEAEDIAAIETVDDLLKKGAVKEDCTVKWAECIKALSGRELESIDFVDIKYIFHIKERTPVRYDYNGKSHWVGVENGKIAFNPLERSACVDMGKPAAMRVLHIKELKNGKRKYRNK